MHLRKEELPEDSCGKLRTNLLNILYPIEHKIKIISELDTPDKLSIHLLTNIKKRFRKEY